MLIGANHKLVTFEQPGNESSCQYELVDAIRVCCSMDEVIMRP